MTLVRNNASGGGRKDMVQLFSAAYNTINFKMKNVVRYRKRTRQTSPISRIPTEILIYIFQLAISGVSCCREDLQFLASRMSVLVLPGVCSRWRHIALDTRFLWSHIDITTKMGHKLGTLSLPNLTAHQLKLASGGPIYLHIHGWIVDLAPNIAPLLKPYFSSISSIVFPNNVRLSEINDILGVFPNHRSTTALQTLIARRISNDWGNRESLDLSLCFRGIVDLQLCCSGYGMALYWNELLSLLNESPSLCILRLGRIAWRSGHKHWSRPIHLPHLQLLDLTGMHQMDTEFFLSTIIPGSAGLDLRLTMHARSGQPSDIYWASLSRFKVVSLYLKIRILNYSERLELYLCHLPELRALFLEPRADEQDLTLQCMTAFSGSGTYAKYPNIKALGLVHIGWWRDRREQVNHLLSAYSLNILVFGNGRPNEKEIDSQRLSDWFSERVESIFFIPKYFELESWDRFVKTKILDKWS